jgi:MFS transporter, DHA1 family, multidrug resistance protein
MPLKHFTPFTALCTVGFFAKFSYALARSPVLPLFALYLGAGSEAIGFAVGISTVTGIFFKMPAGALSDVIGRKRTMLIGLVIFAVMPFAYLFIDNYQTLVIIRFLHGLATAIYGPVSMAVVADVAGERKGELLSWFSSVTIIGNLLGAPLGGLILNNGGGNPTLGAFQTAYLVSGFAGVMALILAAGVLKGDGQQKKHNSLREAFTRFLSGIKEVVSDKRVVITSNMEGLQNMTVGALEAFLPIYAVTVAHLSAFQAGLLWGVQVVATIASKPIMGKVSDRHGRKPLISVGMILCAASFAAIPMLQNFYLLSLAALIFGLGEALVTSSSAALIIDICQEKHFGAAMGTFGTIYDVGHASGPILAGLLIAQLGYQFSFWIMASLLVIAIPVFNTNVTLEKKNPLPR